MLPLITVPTAQASLANAALIAPPVLPGPDLAAGSLTPRPVAANGPAVALFNNIPRGGVAPLAGQTDELEIAELPAEQIARAAGQPYELPLGNSSAFLAQAFGQEEAANDNSATALPFAEDLRGRYGIARPSEDQSQIQPEGAAGYQASLSRNTANLNVRPITSLVA